MVVHENPISIPSEQPVADIHGHLVQSLSSPPCTFKSDAQFGLHHVYVPECTQSLINYLW